MRLLTQITERDASGADLRPPVTFAYGDLGRAYDGSLSVAFGSGSQQLGWGNRVLAYGMESTLESQLLDMDADGRPDRVVDTTAAVAAQLCETSWTRNVSDAAGGLDVKLTANPAPSFALREIPWANAGVVSLLGEMDPSLGEDCSLSGQFSKFENKDPTTEECGPDRGFLGHRVAYKFVDIDNDGDTDLLTALQYDPVFYEPQSPGTPTGNFVAPACVVPQAACMDAAESCSPEGICTFDDQAVQECFNSAPRQDCFLSGTETTPIYNINDGKGPHNGGDYDGALPDLGQQPPNPCSRTRVPLSTNGVFAWTWYKGQGDGTIDTSAGSKTLIWAPIPLSDSSGDPVSQSPRSSSGQTQSIIDLDGDGYLDVVNVTNAADSEDAVNFWQYWRGDGAGNFTGAIQIVGESDRPWKWTVPKGAKPSFTDTHIESPLVTAWQYEGLFDVNGDGRVDLVRSLAPPQGSLPPFGTARVHYNTGRGFDPYGVELSASIFALNHSSHPEDIETNNPKHITDLRATDVDLDGRTDWYQDSVGLMTDAVFWNGGATLEPPQSVPGASMLKETIDISTFLWSIDRTAIDLDGDGIPDGATAGSGTAITEAKDGTRRGVMKSIDNGRGLTVNVAYAAVTHLQEIDPAYNLPSATWVATSLEFVDSHSPLSGGALEKTTYAYGQPVWNQDQDGKYGFRGFDTSTVTGPTGARTVTTYDYATDWSGREAEKVTYADGSDVPHQVATFSWAPMTLFGELETFHQVDGYTYFCDSTTTTVASCTASAPVRRELAEWTPWPTMSPVMNVQHQSWRLDHRATPGETDARDRTDHTLFYDAATYRLRSDHDYVYQWDPGTGAWTGMISHTQHLYDAVGRTENETRVWQNASVYGATVRTFDPATGNLLTVQKPKQVGTSAKTTYTYDTHELYTASTTNELGHVVFAEHDVATGALKRSLGPNIIGGALEETSHTLDGLGRVIETRTTLEGAFGGYAQTLVAKTTYDDLVQPQLVRDKQLIDVGAQSWTKTERTYDGHGRLRWETTFNQWSSGGNATTTYTYDHAGRVASVQLPDPAVTSGSNVTYSYGYDALSRPISIVRPAPSAGAMQSGMVVAYDGLVRTRSECVVVSGVCVTDPDPGTLPAATVLASTQLKYDVFDRLILVGEKVDATNPLAKTGYTYDHLDNLVSILDAEGQTTALAHDWTGNRTAITRAGKTWQYGYDLNGNMVKRIEPIPSSGAEVEYTTTIAYDALDRVTSHMPAARDLSAAERLEFGTTLVVSTYDTATHGVGRLARKETRGLAPAGPSPVLLWADYQYGTRGLVTSETRGFDLTPTGAPFSDQRTVTRTYNALGAELWTQYPNAGSGTSWSSQRTSIRRTYDGRGLPLRVEWLNQSPPREIARFERNSAGRITDAYMDDLYGVDRHGTMTRYDSLGRVTSHRGIYSTDGVYPYTRASQTYTYGATDELATLTSYLVGVPTRTMQFEYDDRHQLRYALDNQNFEGQYAYDTAGRFTSAYVTATGAPDAHPRNVDYFYGGSDPEQVTALMQFGTTTPAVEYVYDDAGNVTQRVEHTSPPAQFSFRYDGDLNQRVATNPSGDKELYFYDGAGSRALAIRKTAGGTYDRARWWFGETEIWFDGDGLEDKTWVHIGLEQATARIQNRVGVEITHHNQLGHMLASFDESGTLVGGYQYGPFGEILAQAGDAANHLRRFNGKESDQLSGLSYYGYRYFDPYSLTWTQADPLYRFAPDAARDEPRRANLYVFTLQNPLSLLDPDGLQPREPNVNKIMRGLQRLAKTLKRAQNKKRAITKRNRAKGKKVKAKAEARHRNMDEHRQKRRNTAVAEVRTASGKRETWVASSENELGKALMDGLEAGERAIEALKDAEKTHAEIKLLEAAKKESAEVLGLGSRWKICSACRQAIEDAQMEILRIEERERAAVRAWREAMKKAAKKQ